MRTITPTPLQKRLGLFTHDCAQVVRIQQFSCHPPWHFLGWWRTWSVPLILRFADETQTDLRLGEHLPVWPTIEPRESYVDLWQKEGQDMRAFWHAVQAYAQQYQDDARLIALSTLPVHLDRYSALISRYERAHYDR